MDAVALVGHPVAMTTELSHATCCDLADREIARFAAAIRGADPKMTVPTCGRWRLSTLVQHIGLIHYWVTGMVAELAQERHQRTVADHPLPADPGAHPDWLAAARTTLVPVLRAADPDAPMWTWGADHHVRFWSRRMVHETAVHRCDADLALGRVPQIEPEVGADGVDEYLANLRPARKFAFDVGKLRGDGERIRLQTSDTGDAWTVALHPAGFDWARDGRGEPTVSVTGQAADLYLLAWGRYPADDRFLVRGDRALLEFWQANSHI